MNTRKLVGLVACGGLLAMVSITPASAWTCGQRAAACLKNSGDARCNEPSRIVSCQKTGSYVSPKGYSWPVDFKKK